MRSNFQITDNIKALILSLIMLLYFSIIQSLILLVCFGLFWFLFLFFYLCVCFYTEVVRWDVFWYTVVCPSFHISVRKHIALSILTLTSFLPAFVLNQRGVMFCESNIFFTFFTFLFLYQNYGTLSYDNQSVVNMSRTGHHLSF